MQQPALEAVIILRAHDLSDFEVRRALPSQQRQMVRPFVPFGQMGPGEFLTKYGLDVRPPPHIGLSTVTRLFDAAFPARLVRCPTRPVWRVRNHGPPRRQR